MATTNNEDKKALIEQVKKLKSLGLDRKTLVPIAEPSEDGVKKPPSWFLWKDYRDGKNPPLTESDIEEIWSKSEVVRAAVALDHSCFLIDVEGEGAAMQNIMMQRMSAELQDALSKTRTTLTPHGFHVFVHLHPEAFPNGVKEMTCWRMDGDASDKGKRKPGEHAEGSGEIRILSQNKYVIEAGEGYSVLDETHEVPIRLSEELSKELVTIYSLLEKEYLAIRAMVSGKKNENILDYYNNQSGLRHDIALGLAGALANAAIPENLAFDLVYYIAKVTKDEELEDRLRAVSDTYKVKRAGEDVAGFSKLIAALDGNDKIITKIREGFLNLGYRFVGANVSIKRSKTETRFYGSVDDIEGNPSEGIGRGASGSRDAVVQVCSPYIKDMFVDKFDVAFAAVEINGRLEVLGIRRHKFKLWAGKKYYDETGTVVAQGALDGALELFESQATYSDKRKMLSLRVSDGSIDVSSQTAEGTSDDQVVLIQPTRIYYDLGNKNHQVVEITPDGWSVKESSEVPQMFYRYQAQQPQVMPTRDYPKDVNIFDRFMDLVNASVKDANGTELPGETKKMRMLLKCYIISLFIPNIPRVILFLYGEQGSAKTALLWLIKMLVDPSGALTLTFPRSIAEIVQQLQHNYIAYYDNVSIIKDWLSDVLCRAATGTGFTKRQLYTDDDDIQYEFIRSVGISAVHLPGSKPDMLDRGLIVKLTWISKEFRRKFEGDILPEFHKLRSQFLGYIFDILVQTLKMKVKGDVELETRSRMADWEEWCEIIARCMGYKPNAFLDAYAENTKLQADLILEDRPVARTLVRLVSSLSDEQLEWTGPMDKLLNILEGVAMELEINTKADRLWPKASNALSFRINEVKPTLRDLGIEIWDEKDSRTRTKIIHIATVENKRKLLSHQQQLQSTDNPEVRKRPFASLASSDTKLQKNVPKGVKDAKDVLHTSSSKPNATDLFDVDKVEVVNIHTATGQPKCDAYIGRNWRESYGPAPLVGADGAFGNPFIIDNDIPHDGTRDDVLRKYENWLKRDDSKGYRKRARRELIACYKWACHCKPDACHGDILKKWLKRELQKDKARKNYKAKSSTKGGDSK